MTVAFHKPKLLFLSQNVPYPPDGGVTIRTFNVIKILARRFDIVGLCFYRATAVSGGKEQMESRLARLRSYGHFEAFPLPQDWSKVRLVRDHVKSLLMARPYTVPSYQSLEYRRRLRELLTEGRYDLVHMDSLDLSYYLPEVAHLPTICVHHNCESALLRRRAMAEKSILRSLYIRLQSTLMRREERRLCPNLSMNITVSGNDGDLLRRIAPVGAYTVVPNGTDIGYFSPGDGDGRRVVFVGGATWFPNRDALEFFSEDVLPQIESRGHRVEVDWIGQAPVDIIRRYRKTSINLTGYVDDVRPLVANAAVYIVPLRVGGGTRLKILNGWAQGKALVSTRIGCEGLEAVHGHNILIADSAKDFADAVTMLLDDENLRRRLGAAGRETVERRYSWEVIGGEMLDRYLSFTSMES